jgi:hypothetical protein
MRSRIAAVMSGKVAFGSRDDLQRILDRRVDVRNLHVAID